MDEDILRTLKKTLIFQQETSTEKQQKQENHELLQTKTPNRKGGSVVIYADYFTFGLTPSRTVSCFSNMPLKINKKTPY